MRGAGALTQFQAAGGSLLEESAALTQVQLAGTPPGTQPHTRGLARYPLSQEACTIGMLEAGVMLEASTPTGMQANYHLHTHNLARLQGEFMLKHELPLHLLCGCVVRQLSEPVLSGVPGSASFARLPSAQSRMVSRSVTVVSRLAPVIAPPLLGMSKVSACTAQTSSGIDKDFPPATCTEHVHLRAQRAAQALRADGGAVAVCADRAHDAQGGRAALLPSLRCALVEGGSAGALKRPTVCAMESCDCLVPALSGQHIPAWPKGH